MNTKVVLGSRRSPEAQPIFKPNWRRKLREVKREARFRSYRKREAEKIAEARRA